MSIMRISRREGETHHLENSASSRGGRKIRERGETMTRMREEREERQIKSDNWIGLLQTNSATFLACFPWISFIFQPY